MTSASVEARASPVPSLEVSTGDLPSPSNKLQSPKKVGFHAIVTVVLIPERQELVSAELSHLLWWTKTDFSAFKDNLRQELRMLRALTPPAPTLSSASAAVISPACGTVY